MIEFLHLLGTIGEYALMIILILLVLTGIYLLGFYYGVIAGAKKGHEIGFSKGWNKGLERAKEEIKNFGSK